MLCGVDEDGDGEYTAEGITAIANALRVNASITQVCQFWKVMRYGLMSVCVSGPEANHAYAYALQLDLRDNNMGPEGAKALAPALSVNASLTQVCQIREVMRCGFRA